MVIVAAVDRSDRARGVVEEAATLAEVFDDDVHVVHALSRGAFVDLEQTAVEETGRPIAMDDVRAYARDHAESVAADLDVAHQAVGLVGDAADEIVDYAEDVDARFIVVGPRRRSPAGKAVFGSVAQSILLHAACPVVSTTQ